MTYGIPSQFYRFIDGADFPCSKEDLLDHAKSNGAGDDVLETLQDLPMDTFNSLGEVGDAVSDMYEEDEEE